MKRLWSRNGLTLLICVFAIMASTAFSQAPDPSPTDIKWVPTLVLPNDSAVALCTNDSVCFVVSGTDVDLNETLILSLVSGPITFAPRTFSDDFSTPVCFTPTTSGNYRFIFALKDKYNQVTRDTVTFTVTLNAEPVIADTDFKFDFCGDLGVRELPMNASDPDNDPLTFTLLSGPGSINSETGLLTYTPAEPGVVTFEVEVADKCATDTALITDVVTVNYPPVLTLKDSTIYLCTAQEICVDIKGTDPEELPITISKITGTGSFEMTGSTAGRLCFLPDQGDSASYQFVFCVDDNCGGETLCHEDTVTYTVVINRAPEVICPEPQRFATCQPDTFCFNYKALDADGDELVYRLLSDNALLSEGEICVPATGPDSFDVVIEVVDLCGAADTCRVPVIITGGTPPSIVSADDFEVSVCGPEQVCFRVMIVENGSTPVVTTNIGSYNPLTGLVCFDADTTATYRVITTVTDTVCNVSDSDTTLVTVKVNGEPLVRFEKEADTALCFAGELCYPVTVNDDNVQTLSVEGGAFNAEAGTICFTPTASGTYSLSIVLVDDCGLTSGDTMKVVVTLGHPPTITLRDTSIYMCAPTKICIPAVVTDLDGDIISIKTNRGTYADGSVCFVPYSAGVYPIIVTVQDNCGSPLVDTALVTIKTDQSFVMTGPKDTTIFMCQPDTLCFPIGGIPEDATVRVIGTAVRWDAESQSVCFISDCCLENTVTVEATTPCGTIRTHTFTVTVRTNQPPVVLLPRDSTLNLCGPTSICLPVAVSDPDENLISVQVSGGDYNPATNTVCLNIDTSGTYILETIVTDACDLTATDLMVITANVNNEPAVEFLAHDETYHQCAPTPICLPIEFADPDGDQLTITASAGATFDAEHKTICFTPTKDGETCITVFATDRCGLTDTASTCVNVITDAEVAIACSTEPYSEISCGPKTICLPVIVEGNPISVTPSFGTYADGELCFDADTTGTYAIRVIADGVCNSDTCIFSANITITDSVEVTCRVPSDTTVFLCVAKDTLNFPVSITGSPQQVTITPSGAWYEDGFVNVPVTEPGQIVVQIIAAGLCNSDTCGFDLAVQDNLPPAVTTGKDSTISYCGEPEAVVIPFTAFDPNNNVTSITSTFGSVAGNNVTFLPTTPGVYPIIIRATDNCGAFDEDTIVITYNALPATVITCPDPSLIPVLADLPDSIRIAVGISPSNAVVSITPNGVYDVITGEVVVDVEAPGTFSYTVIASAECGDDTCSFTLDVNQNEPPLLKCRDNVDTLLCFEQADTICLPLEYTGTNVTITVLGDAYFDNGNVCVPVSSAGTYEVTAIASNGILSDTCTTTLVVRGGRNPVVNLPEDLTVSQCGPGEICLELGVNDLDGDLVEVLSSLGTADYHAGAVCFTPETAGTYALVVTAIDSCGLQGKDTVNVTVIRNEDPTISYGADISVALCGVSEVCLPLAVADDNLASVNVTGGLYDPATGKVCFLPNGTGSYQLVATAVDSCGAEASDTITVTVTVNDNPIITSLRDTSITMCAPYKLCLPISISDPNNNIASVKSNRGTYENGAICFVPYSAGSYKVILTVTDTCGAQAVDTAIVTVATDQAFTITGPGDTTIFMCTPDTLCFPIGGIPSDATVRVIGTAVRWDAENQEVCFISDCCLENTITVEATSPCGTIRRHTFTVNVRTNSQPIVALGADTSFVTCAPDRICLPVGISDVDHNIASITAAGATYSPVTSTVCFDVAEAGDHIISVTVVDSCGKSMTDVVHVNVRLNARPQISYVPITEPIKVCVFTPVCVPVTITDSDNNVANVAVTGGTWDAANRQVCITPSAIGQNCAQITVTDSCGAMATTEICITVEMGGLTEIVCPTFQTRQLCAPGEVCVPLTINGGVSTVTTSFGSYSGGQICFPADTSGVYSFRVIATSECNADTCDFTVPVEILPSVNLTCPVSETVFLCAVDTVCYPFSLTGAPATLRVSSNAYISGNEICVPLLTGGAKIVQLIATGQCEADTCSFTVTANFNRPPVVAAAKDSTIIACSLSQVCFDFTASDPDNNLKSVTTTLGTINGNKVCFTPSAYGTYTAVVRAEDVCGAFAVDTVKLVVQDGARAVVSCPEGEQFANICGPDSVRYFVVVQPANATVRVLPAGAYNPTTGKIAFKADTTGHYGITVIATAPCAADTCSFVVNVTKGVKPDVVCPGSIDTTMCLAKPDTLCFPVTVTGTGATVTVSPSGYYSAGYVCVPITAAGTYTTKIIATGTCGSDTCQTVIRVTADKAPTITLPADITVERCPDDEDQICIDGIFGADAEKPAFISKICGPGTFTVIGGDSGKVCFTPTQFGITELCFEVTDGCQTVRDTLRVTVNQKADCDVCVRVSMDAGECTPVGLNKEVRLMVETNDPIAGFNLLLSYDASAISFQTATIAGSDIQGWEYFNYRLNNGGCGSACPSGLMRLVGLADVNNGGAHPPDSTKVPNGILVKLNFRMSNDQTLGGQFVPINFVWYDCGDNTFSDTTGQLLLVDKRIYNNEGLLVWDEDDNVRYPESSRQFGLGAPDDCVEGGEKTPPVRCIEFFNGGICIIHPDSIDARGDVNLNNIAYDISDAVIFTQYFIRGLSAFQINVAGQVAATDCNADGLTLTVADLTYLIRVLVGDASPIPKVSPLYEDMMIKSTQEQNNLAVATEAVSTIGAAYLVYHIDDGVTIGEPRLKSDADGMEILYAVEGNTLRLLVYNIGKNRIAAGSRDIIDIPFTGEGDITLDKAEVADYDGRAYLHINASAALPREYSLEQNYPNPFNPSTTISFGLPTESDWALRIFNITGTLVREFTGNSSAGLIEVEWDGVSGSGQKVASGVYLYRLEAGSFSQTRKMVLLK